MLKFLLDHAPLERWERDVLEVIRDEAYYFVPQMQTKIMNEGWACVRRDTPRVHRARAHHDGAIWSRARRASSPTARPTGTSTIATSSATTRRSRCATRRGFELCGSNNHRVLLADGDDVEAARRARARRSRRDRRAVRDLWPSEVDAATGTTPQRTTLEDVAAAAGVSVWTGAPPPRGRTIRRRRGDQRGARRVRARGQPGAAAAGEQARPDPRPARGRRRELARVPRLPGRRRPRQPREAEPRPHHRRRGAGARVLGSGAICSTSPRA